MFCCWGRRKWTTGRLEPVWNLPSHLLPRFLPFPSKAPNCPLIPQTDRRIQTHNMYGDDSLVLRASDGPDRIARTRIMLTTWSLKSSHRDPSASSKGTWTLQTHFSKGTWIHRVRTWSLNGGDRSGSSRTTRSSSQVWTDGRSTYGRRARHRSSAYCRRKVFRSSSRLGKVFRDDSGNVPA